MKLLACVMLVVLFGFGCGHQPETLGNTHTENDAFVVKDQIHVECWEKSPKGKYSVSWDAHFEITNGWQKLPTCKGDVAFYWSHDEIAMVQDGWLWSADLNTLPTVEVPGCGVETNTLPGITAYCTEGSLAHQGVAVNMPDGAVLIIPNHP